MHTAVTRNRPDPANRAGVTPDNWIDGPFNRWGFRHVRELASTARISRGQGTVRHLPERFVDLSEFTTQVGGEPFTLVEALEAAYADAFVVVRDGALVHEWYAEGMDPHGTHLLMSVSKSLTATLIGSLVGEGLVDPAASVVTYVPELKGTAWDGATVQHLLDMSAGVAFNEEDYDDPESDGCLVEFVSGYRPRHRDDLPTDTAAWILALTSQGEHGDRFQYRSIITDVLGMVIESVSGQRFSDVFSDRIWSRIGAEHDADVIVDSKGFPTVEGGICATARDLARFGLLHLERGAVGGAQVVPAEWTDRILSADPTLIAHYSSSSSGDPATPQAYYHDCWWVWDAAKGRYAGHGINGQMVLVDRSTNTVIAMMSTWPHRMDPQLSDFGSRVAEELLDHLSR
jgi:CubicO group peptidase (beta-lactamase class C family)